jgi:response regulator RpfG family c-di-GMP phosphodiesterase
MDDRDLKAARILIVDDEPENVHVLERILEQEGYENLSSTTDPAKVVGLCVQSSPDLVLLDLQMPAIDGFEVLRQLAPWIRDGAVPVVVLTADSAQVTKQKAHSEGASDFLTKPFDAFEALLRIENLLKTRFLQVELRKQNLILEQRVRERTEDLAVARLEILKRLAIAAEYKDDETGGHIQRVGRTSGLLAETLGLDREHVELIRNAAPLHDVGKIGVPDSVLLKPGRLTPEERKVMQTHVRIGGSILSKSRSPLLRVAQQMALTHHEWWDGHGYLAGLQGDEIPLSGRIVALADVFDALTQDRPYKRALPVEQACEEIRALSARQFDPQVVEAFLKLEHRELIAPGEAAYLSSSGEEHDAAALSDAEHVAA